MPTLSTKVCHEDSDFPENRIQVRFPLSSRANPAQRDPRFRPGARRWCGDPDGLTDFDPSHQLLICGWLGRVLNRERNAVSWRALDQHGVVLDILVQERRSGAAAKRRPSGHLPQHVGLNEPIGEIQPGADAVLRLYHL